MERRIAIKLVVAAVLVVIGLSSIVYVVVSFMYAVQDVALKTSGASALVARSPDFGLRLELLAIPAGLVEIGIGIGLAIGALLELRAERTRRRGSG